ncbi:hypothetical protein [Burkholderia arboris]|uniref:hypothetical protein n=1 Tax=Burkholderia arboris TaxID=488730 RepID=UPI002109D948|nr:hypothetical protein [Burkholderia arboris]UTV53230.1 hypothetical protein NLX30_10030 [Burkholderia arboris]
MPPVQDNRADSTADQKPAPVDPLAAIAQEELDENAAIREKQERDAQAQADDEAQARLDGWREVTTTGQELVTAAWPGLRPVWNDGAMERMAVALALCDERYEWGGAGVLKNSPLLLLGLASFPLAVGTVAFVKAEKQKALIVEKLRRDGIAVAEVAPGVMRASVPAESMGQDTAPDAAPAPAPEKNGEKPLNVAGGIDAALSNMSHAR